jgi:hypothetical protein
MSDFAQRHRFGRVGRIPTPTPFELGERMFRRVLRDQLYLVLSEVVGHLDLLEREGSVARREVDGAFRYAVTGAGASSGGEA